ncbi:MAG: UvrD-helicase domain-containing protein [Gemmatimonadota bacterium]
MTVRCYRDFGRALNALWRKGGRFQKAAEEVRGVVGGAYLGDDPFASLRQTKKGEKRIKNCVKFDLENFCRLVTVRVGDTWILLFCGSHEECDSWLDTNRGLLPVVSETGVVTATWESIDESGLGLASSRAAGKLYQRLPEALFDQLIAGLHRSKVRELEALEAHVTDGEMWEILARVDSDALRLALFDVLALLRSGKAAEASLRAQLFLGIAKPLESIRIEDLPALVDSEVIRRIDPTSTVYKEALSRFMRTARYRDWMLFMHPAQDAVADEDFAGSAKLVGVSGSGKTCVVVRRAVRLARAYPGESILVLTLNPALARLIRMLIAESCDSAEAERITVKPFYELCRDLMLTFDPRGSRKYRETTWKHDEHVDEIWLEYYRCENNNPDASVLQPLHDHLLARGWTPDAYIREEIDWLRSALPESERDTYLDPERVKRRGRTVPLSTPFRQVVLEGAEGWAAKMDAVGVRDLLALAQAVSQRIASVSPQYRCALVDEVQDLGNVELRIVRALVKPDANDLFFTGDAAQAVTSKYQHFREIGIDIPSARSRRLDLNYRNSREILAIAHSILTDHMTEEMQDREDLPILDPEYSQFNGGTPLLLEGSSLSNELTAAIQLSEERLATTPDAKICIAVCGHSYYELCQYGADIGLQVLDGSIDIDEGSIFLSDLEQTKGFEFDLVCIVNCSFGIIPDGSAPDSELFRDLARFYVAMTRAKTDLVLSWSGAPSVFVKGRGDQLLEATWAEYVDVSNARVVKAPAALEDLHEASANHNWRTTSGADFLFSPDALGTSIELSNKIRQLVDGKGLRKGTDPLKWKNMGRAADDYRTSPFARRQWGPEVGKQFEELVSRLPAS